MKMNQVTTEYVLIKTDEYGDIIEEDIYPAREYKRALEEYNNNTEWTSLEKWVSRGNECAGVEDREIIELFARED